MTLYAHTDGTTVDTVSALPRLYFDGIEWHDWRGAGPWRTQPSSAGWFPIALTPRPDDTDTTTSVEGYKVENGLPVQTWKPRPWTAAELAYRAAESNRATVKADTTADLALLAQSITELATLLADETTVGSIRSLIGPTGATAGTTNLRALAAQTNAAVVTAASVKALIRVNIDLAQLSINDVQATRRVARQVLRLAKALVGDYSSADVGTQQALK